MEKVLTVKRGLVEKLLPQAGVTTLGVDKLVDIIISDHEFLPRAEAEDDPSHKQIIPYVLLCREDRIFATRRLKKGGEARLHGLISLGVGGHINPESDGDGEDVLYRGMNREIDEEVYITSRGELVPRGMINDDTNEVGQVHLGLLFTMEVEGEVTVRETEKLEGFWLSRSELAEKKDEMETWSQLAIQALFGI